MGVGGYRAWSATTWLIVANVAVFVLLPLLGDLGRTIYSLMSFQTQASFQRLEVWRLVTFQFLHANLLHLAFNMLGLWVFGRTVEAALGAKRYLAFYLVCGICGGLTFSVLNLLHLVVPGLPGAIAVPLGTELVGASAGVFGVIVACARLTPDLELLFFGIIPMNIRTLAWLWIGFSALNLFVLQGPNQGGDAAHLGGALAGFFFSRNHYLLRDFFDVLGNSNLPPKKRKRRQAGLRPGDNPVAGRIGPGPYAKKKGAGAGSRERDEIDRVLKKIAEEGIESITPAEQRLLEEERDRLQQRS